MLGLEELVTAVTAMVGAPLLQLALLELSPFTTAVGVRVGVGVFGVAGVVSETFSTFGSTFAGANDESTRSVR